MRMFQDPSLGESPKRFVCHIVNEIADFLITIHCDINAFPVFMLTWL
jgi:hypothetical protein